MPKYHLPLLTERSISEAHANRLASAEAFEAKTLGIGGVSCSAGCSNCCHYPLSVSILDGISLYQWLVSHGHWNNKLKARLQEHKDQTWDLAPEVWSLAMIPCPLLSEKGLCSAYEARPFLCRTLFSRGDPHYCHPHRMGAGLAGILHREAEVDALWKAERQLLKRHQLRQILLPLSTALLLGERVAKGDLEIEETHTILLEEHTQR